MNSLESLRSFRNTWKYVQGFIRQLTHQFSEDGCIVSAAALTFTTIIAIVPFFAIVYRILSLMPEFSHVGHAITGFIFDTFVPSSSDVVLEKVREFSAKANELTFLGVAIVAISTMFMLSTMEDAFNRIWRVSNKRSGISRWIFYWGILAFGVPMIGVAFTSSTYGLGIDHIDSLQATPVMEWLRELISPIAMATTFTLIYYAVPSIHVRLIHAFAGGLVTTTLLVIAQMFFSWLVPFLQGEVIYGVFAALPLFAIGLYIIWVVVIIGALVARTLSLTYLESKSDGVPLVIKGVKVLRLLHDAHVEGNSIVDDAILRQVPMTRSERNRVFEALQEGKWMQSSQKKTWTLGRSLQSTSLWDLLMLLPEDIRESKLDSNNTIDSRFRSFLKTAAVHLQVPLSLVIQEEEKED